MPKARLLIVGALLLIGQTSPALNPAENLAAEFSSLKNLKTLDVHFTCEKRMAMLETPLVSEGELWISKSGGGNGGGEPSVRFSTRKPYLSELILTDGKLYARSQHESDWTKSDQSNRPGLPAVMQQLGRWSLGDAGALTQMYDVAASPEKIPPNPTHDAQTPPAAMYTLTPKNPDLAKAIQNINLAIDPATHHLIYIAITTKENDQTRYWFYDVAANTDLPADIFKPSGGKP